MFSCLALFDLVSSFLTSLSVDADNTVAMVARDSEGTPLTCFCNCNCCNCPCRVTCEDGGAKAATFALVFNALSDAKDSSISSGRADIGGSGGVGERRLREAADGGVIFSSVSLLDVRRCDIAIVLMNYELIVVIGLVCCCVGRAHPFVSLSLCAVRRSPCLLRA